MPKQYRVIKRTEVVSSYMIEVPDGENLNELLENNYADGWEKHVFACVYEEDPTDTHVIEAWSLKEEVDADSPLIGDFGNDDECVWEDN